MSQYANLKAAIAANVYQNHNNEVTANMVKAAMNAMTDSLGAGYQYLGIATPATTPGTPDQKVFYIAPPGEYPNFGTGISVAEGEVAILKWDTAWHKEVTGAATAAQVTELGQKQYDFALSATPSESISPSDLLWEQKTITNYVTSASANRCIALVRLANVSHIKIIPASNWYINVWFYKEFMPSAELISADYGVSNVGSTQNTIDMDVPSGAKMMAIWCRRSDQANFTPADAPASLTSVELVTDHKKIAQLEATIGEILTSIVVYPKVIASALVPTDLPDVNDAKDNTLYLLTTGNNLPQNLPSDITADGELRYILTIASKDALSNTFKRQIIFDYKVTPIYERRYSAHWYNWVSLVSTDAPLKVYPKAIRRQNYTTLLPDANNAEDNTIYIVYTNQGTRPDNFPPQYRGDGSIYILKTITSLIESTYIRIQTLEFIDGTEYYERRNSGATWSEWVNKVINKTLFVGSGQEFTTIKSALERANVLGNCDIYVLAGTYDIIQEYGGEEALETAVADGDYGLKIGFGNRIHFASDAYVICNYEGDSNLVMERFAPFNASTNQNINKQGFFLEGLNISCKNVRYCVHDEGAGMSMFHHHTYKDCTMYIDNRESTYVNTYVACIGGGLGKAERIDIIGGYYKSETSDSTRGTISYHNAVGTGATANSRSEINIDGVYFDGDGSVSFGYYGASTLITKCFVRNCSMKTAPNVHAETEQSTIVNMQLFAWNNEIRS